MAISPLVFESHEEIPFVNLQQATLHYNVEDELMVKLDISNELIALPTGGNSVNFGNFVFLSTDKNALDRMIYNTQNMPDMSRLKNLIVGTKLKTSRIRNREFLLTSKDFTFKTLVSDRNTDKSIYQYLYSEESTLRDTKGGSVTSGLITAAHTQDDEILNLDNREVSSLYVLVASYRVIGDTCSIGNVMRETLMENGISSPTARIYRLKESLEFYGNAGDIWPGDIHIQGNTIMAGTHHHGEIHPALDPTLVENFKIQDLRFIAKARALNFENKPFVQEEKPYFSPITLSRSPSGEIKGLFSFDLKAYAVNNARFGGLIKNVSALLSTVRLKDIKLYRRVISPGAQSNSLTPGTGLNLGETTPSVFKYFASMKDKNVQLLRIPSIENEGLVNIVFRDTQASTLAAGVAEYRVEIVAADDSALALEQMRNTLQAALRAYTVNITGLAKKENILDKMVDSYLAVVNFIFGAIPFVNFSMQNWKKNLIALGSLANSNVADHLLVSEIVETFTAQISNALMVTHGETSLSSKSYSKIYTSTKVGSLATEHVFRQRYALKNRKEVGFDYMGDYLTNTSTALPMVSYEDMSGRISQEITKYSVPNPNAASINTYGYMSPLKIRTGLKNHSISTLSVQVDTDAMTGLLRDRLSPTIELAMEEQKSSTTNIQESLAMVGVNVEPLEESLRELLFPDSQKLSEGVSSEEYLSRRSQFVNDDTYIRSRLSGSNNTIITNPVSRSTRIFGTPLARTIFERQIVQFQPTVRMQNRTTLPGALAIAADNAFPTSQIQIDTVSKIINFDSLVRVEYLKSYDRRLGVLAPNWVLLNEEAFKDALDRQIYLICRLVRVQQTVNAKNILDMESLGTLFVLGSPQNAPASTSYREFLKNIYAYIGKVNSEVSKEITNKVEAYYARNVPLIAKPTTASGTPAPTMGSFRTTRLGTSITGY
tara:strand:- start:6825 stop:9650 length:2826 start_codon:yes stop_codon:yes gene_type:complete